MSGQISVQNDDSLSGLVSNLSKCQNFVWTRDMAYQTQIHKKCVRLRPKSVWMRDMAYKTREPFEKKGKISGHVTCHAKMRGPTKKFCPGAHNVWTWDSASKALVCPCLDKKYGLFANFGPRRLDWDIGFWPNFPKNVWMRYLSFIGIIRGPASSR
jgi:hypothetical protein